MDALWLEDRGCLRLGNLLSEMGAAWEREGKLGEKPSLGAETVTTYIR